ncbi:MAG: methyltransferase [Chromatiales bacterium]
MPLDPDIIRKLRQEISFIETLKGRQLHFRTTWGLFSPKAIDEGTRLLLEHLEVESDDRAIDLGCGYGPIGLTIAALASQGNVLMVDKDFVAVEYANRNAELNHLHNAKAMLSDGLKHIGKKKFTLAVTNLPAKTSNEHYYLFFQDIYEHLEPGGRFYVVVISGLRNFIKRAFNEVFGNHKKIKQGKSYTVAMAVKK